jgi:hypothetical protein
MSSMRNDTLRAQTTLIYLILYNGGTRASWIWLQDGKLWKRHRFLCHYCEVHQSPELLQFIFLSLSHSIWWTFVFYNEVTIINMNMCAWLFAWTYMYTHTHTHTHTHTRRGSKWNCQIMGRKGPNWPSFVTKGGFQYWDWDMSIWNVAKTKGCSSQIDSKACLLKATPTQLIRHRKIELVPT